MNNCIPKELLDTLTPEQKLVLESEAERERIRAEEEKELINDTASAIRDRHLSAALSVVKQLKAVLDSDEAKSLSIEAEYDDWDHKIYIAQDGELYSRHVVDKKVHCYPFVHDTLIALGNISLPAIPKDESIEKATHTIEELARLEDEKRKEFFAKEVGKAAGYYGLDDEVREIVMRQYSDLTEKSHGGWRIRNSRTYGECPLKALIRDAQRDVLKSLRQA